MRDILMATGMTQGELPSKYLGVPLSSRKLTVMQCLPLIKKITSRIDCWSSKLLSYAGRIQLIRSVLFGVQIYWGQVFILPQKVMQAIQSVCRTFLWTWKAALSKRALVAWDKICMPKSAGGLNIIDMRVWNKAAICKLLWCLAQKKDKIWVQWVHGYYIKDGEVSSMELPQQSCWIIRKIIGARSYLRDIHDGKDWLGAQTCSIKEIYLAMKGSQQRVAWGKLISQNSAPPKCIFISWLLMHNSLATCEYLRKIGIVVEQECCFCSREHESTDHLFFECAYTGRIWTNVTAAFGLDRLQRALSREMPYLISQCTTKNGSQLLYKSVFSIIIYMIWIERNRRRLQGLERDVDEVIHQCILMINGCCHRSGRLANFLVNRG